MARHAAGLPDTSQHTGWVETADLVLGCDGRGSSVRAHAGLALRRTADDYDVLRFKVRAPDRLVDRSGFLICVRAGAHPAVGYVSWDGRLQYGLVMPKGGLRSVSAGDWLAEAVRVAPAFRLAEEHRTEDGGPTPPSRRGAADPARSRGNRPARGAGA
jgi:2-polyprenyl-6-methoxyphenol hydroxylase-like FAD-dependent oxidoreductase